eukprot:COSAG06_NODE_29828_length_549_cov_140.142222_1_plen_112_part_10
MYRRRARQPTEELLRSDFVASVCFVPHRRRRRRRRLCRVCRHNLAIVPPVLARAARVRASVVCPLTVGYALTHPLGVALLSCSRMPLAVLQRALPMPGDCIIHTFLLLLLLL